MMLTVRDLLVNAPESVVNVSLLAIYNYMVRADSDVSGMYSLKAKFLHDKILEFWRFYETRQAFLATQPTIFVPAASGVVPVESTRYQPDYLVGLPHQGPPRRHQTRSEEECTEHRHSMVRYKREEQRCFDVYSSGMLDIRDYGDEDGDEDVKRRFGGEADVRRRRVHATRVTREYRRKFSGLIRLIVQCNTDLARVQRDMYLPSVFLDMHTNDHDIGNVDLGMLCDNITCHDSDVRGLSRDVGCYSRIPRSWTPATLDASMERFWYAYDAEEESARSSPEFRRTMEGYKMRAQRFAEVLKTDNRELEELLAEMVEGCDKNSDGVFMSMSNVKRFRDHTLNENVNRYKARFAALLKSMMPYLQEQKEAMFTRIKFKCGDPHQVPRITSLPSDIHEKIQAFARTNPFVRLGRPIPPPSPYCC